MADTSIWIIGDRGWLVWTQPGETIDIGPVGEKPVMKLRPETAQELLDVLPAAIKEATASDG